MFRINTEGCENLRGFSTRIHLSNELKSTTISELLAKAKASVKEKGYSYSTRIHYYGKFRDLQQYAAKHCTETLSEEFITQYLEEGMQRGCTITGSSYQRKTLLNFVAAAINSAPVFVRKKESDKIQSKPLKENLDRYEQHLREQGKRKDTIASYLKVATKFLLFLDRKGKYDFSEVDGINIRDFISELSNNWKPRSMRSVPSLLKIYLKFSGVHTEAILFSNFRTPCLSKPVRAMSNENVEALWKYVEGDDGDLRNKAIATMLLATGMRPSDISALKLDDINWNNDIIGFTQSKTDGYMNLELFPAMGTAIVRYITEQRPKGTGEKFVFLTKKAPYRRLVPTAINSILRVALAEVGIPFVADGLHCPRATRRSLVSRMIAKGIPVQKAAAAIGHVDDKSVDLYTELDVKIMRSICLAIPSPMKGWLQSL